MTSHTIFFVWLMCVMDGDDVLHSPPCYLMTQRIQAAVWSEGKCIVNLNDSLTIQLTSVYKSSPLQSIITNTLFL